MDWYVNKTKFCLASSSFLFFKGTYIDARCVSFFPADFCIRSPLTLNPISWHFLFRLFNFSLNHPLFNRKHGGCLSFLNRFYRSAYQFFGPLYNYCVNDVFLYSICSLPVRCLFFFLIPFQTNWWSHPVLLLSSRFCQSMCQLFHSHSKGCSFILLPNSFYITRYLSVSVR